MEKENLETDSSHDDIISVQKGKRDREDINGESENSANKKQSVGSSIPNDVKVSSDSVVAAVEEEDKGSSNCCALCMEGADEKKNIIPHNCSQCKKDAWVICDLCNESRLSRACPMCNGDYVSACICIIIYTKYASLV